MAPPPTPLSIKWVIIGTAAMGSLSWLLPQATASTLLPPLVEGLGLQAGWIAFAVIVSFAAFFGGSLVTALFSPGNTIREPAIASTIAIGVNQAYYLANGGELSTAGIAIAIVLGYAFSFAGATVGEKLQGDTTDKMRERGELRR